MGDSLEILFEDTRFLAVNKPAGLLSIPGRDPKEASAVKLLRSIRKGGGLFVVHRIDRGTSGVLIFAKTEDAHRLANEWFREHRARKEYLALAAGAPRMPAMRLSTPVEDKPSLSQVQVVERFDDAFLARVRIATGRRHQIRIHLRDAGHPILGDRIYGGAESLGGVRFGRPALHAELLVLPATESSPSVEIRAPLPEDFEAWLSALRNRP
jgi:RluA family pseudouridine synthase